MVFWCMLSVFLWVNYIFLWPNDIPVGPLYFGSCWLFSGLGIASDVISFLCLGGFSVADSWTELWSHFLGFLFPVVIAVLGVWCSLTTNHKNGYLWLQVLTNSYEVWFCAVYSQWLSKPPIHSSVSVHQSCEPLRIIHLGPLYRLLRINGAGI